MGYSKEILLDQEAAKQYICKICTNVLKDAIQVHCGADAEEHAGNVTARSRSTFVNLVQKVFTFK